MLRVLGIILLVAGVLTPCATLVLGGWLVRTTTTVEGSGRGVGGGEWVLSTVDIDVNLFVFGPSLAAAITGLVLVVIAARTPVSASDRE